MRTRSGMRGEQRVDPRGVGRTHEIRRMGAGRGAEERALEVDAQDRGLRGVVRGRRLCSTGAIERRFVAVERGADERRAVGGDAVSEESAARARAQASASALTKSTSPTPLTWRSMKPGPSTALPRSRAPAVGEVRRAIDDDAVLDRDPSRPCRAGGPDRRGREHGVTSAATARATTSAGVAPGPRSSGPRARRSTCARVCARPRSPGARRRRAPGARLG